VSAPGLFRPPAPANEPVLEYAPGSPERAELQRRLAELTEAADGRWLGQGRLLSLAGRWSLTATIQRPSGGITVPLAVDVPAPDPS
jgi:hypothetical protein